MMNDKRSKKNGDPRLLRALSFFPQFGVMVAACVLIGVFLGKYLDELLGTAPWLLLTFSLLGAAASIKALFDLAYKK